MGRAARGRSPQISAPLASSSYTAKVETQVCGMMSEREDSGCQRGRTQEWAVSETSPKIYSEERGFLFKKTCFQVDRYVPRLGPPVQPIPWTHTSLCRQQKQMATWHGGIKVSMQSAKWYLTSFTRCPGVLEIAHVHSFLLGYLSGQLGLVMVPLVDVTLCSQPAVGYE